MEAYAWNFPLPTDLHDLAEELRDDALRALPFSCPLLSYPLAFVTSAALFFAVRTVVKASTSRCNSSSGSNSCDRASSSSSSSAWLLARRRPFARVPPDPPRSCPQLCPATARNAAIPAVKALLILQAGHPVKWPHFLGPIFWFGPALLFASKRSLSK